MQIYSKGDAIINNFLGEIINMTNLDFYGMFDFAQGDSDIYQYTSAEFSEFIKPISGNGIVNSYGDKFLCTASGLDITMGSGMCLIEGRYGGNRSEKTFSLDAESVSLKRIDRIVLALDAGSRTIGYHVVKGTASSTPSAPELTQTETYYEIPVYEATITNGSTVTLTDERNYIYTNAELLTMINGKLSSADGAVRNANLANSSVSTSKIGNGAVTGVKLGDILRNVYMESSADEINETGFFRVSDNMIIIHVNHDSDNAMQIGNPYNSSILTYRVKISGVWQPWETIA